MANPRFRCPNCNTLLIKSDAEQVLGDAGGFIAFGSPVRPCPSCRNNIDRKSIIAGAYDEKPGNGLAVLLAIIAAVIVVLWLAS